MIDLYRETRLPLSHAAKEAGVSICSIRPWILTGRRGIRLESFLIGGRRATTREALHRFYGAVTTAVDGARSTSESHRTTNLAAAEAGRKLDTCVFGRAKRRSHNRNSSLSRKG